MKRLLIGTMLILSTNLVYAEKCWLSYYGFCVESIDYNESDDLKCQELAEKRCSLELTEAEFINLVENLT